MHCCSSILQIPHLLRVRAPEGARGLGGRQASFSDQKVPSAPSALMEAGGRRPKEASGASAATGRTWSSPQRCWKPPNHFGPGPHEAELNEPQVRLPNPRKVSSALRLIVLFSGTIIVPQPLSTFTDAVSFAPNQPCEQLHAPVLQMRELRWAGSERPGRLRVGPEPGRAGPPVSSHTSPAEPHEKVPSCLGLSGEDEAGPALGSHAPPPTQGGLAAGTGPSPRPGRLVCVPPAALTGPVLHHGSQGRGSRASQGPCCRLCGGKGQREKTRNTKRTSGSGQPW